MILCDKVYPVVFLEIIFLFFVIYNSKNDKEKKLFCDGTFFLC